MHSGSADALLEAAFLASQYWLVHSGSSFSEPQRCMSLLIEGTDPNLRVSGYILDNGADVEPLTPTVPLYNMVHDKQHTACLIGAFQGLSGAIAMLAEYSKSLLPLHHFGALGKERPLSYSLEWRLRLSFSLQSSKVTTPSEIVF